MGRGGMETQEGGVVYTHTHMYGCITLLYGRNQQHCEAVTLQFKKQHGCWEVGWGTDKIGLAIADSY